MLMAAAKDGNVAQDVSRLAQASKVVQRSMAAASLRGWAEEFELKDHRGAGGVALSYLLTSSPRLLASSVLDLIPSCGSISYRQEGTSVELYRSRVQATALFPTVLLLLSPYLSAFTSLPPAPYRSVSGAEPPVRPRERGCAGGRGWRLLSAPTVPRQLPRAGRRCPQGPREHQASKHALRGGAERDKGRGRGRGRGRESGA